MTKHDCTESGCASIVKTCPRCSQSLPLTSYYIHHARKYNNHHSYTCKECDYVRTKERIKKHTETNRTKNASHTCDECRDVVRYCKKCNAEHSLLLYVREDSRSSGHAGYCKITSYKQGADSRNLSWELDVDYATHLMFSACMYCQSPANPTNGIDRLDNAIGYTRSNCVPCCEECNYAKHANNAFDFIAWALRLADGINSRRDKFEEILRNHGRL